ncbi:MAG TPA: hypothetical protein DCG38_03100 [Eubacteriaceae bacterium]|jgi:hypothetical protein|nr:hypothetical protein [Eubacteriaceae bacterium]
MATWLSDQTLTQEDFFSMHDNKNLKEILYNNLGIKNFIIEMLKSLMKTLINQNSPFSFNMRKIVTKVTIIAI